MKKYILKKDQAVMVIVDMQERLAAVMSERKKVADNTIHLIELCRLQGMPVILNEQYPKGLGPTVPEIREALKDNPAHEKTTFSCCGEGGFLPALNATEKKQIILVGMETHVCVLQTCLDLLKGDFIVHAVADAICSRTKENYKIGLGIMKDAGAVITSTETVLFQVLEKAGTEEFKIISKRIR